MARRDIRRTERSKQGANGRKAATTIILTRFTAYPVDRALVQLKRTTVSTCSLEEVDYSVSDICGWKIDVEPGSRGEFWIDREALTQRMSKLSPTQRAFFRWGIVEQFNRGLEQILEQDQAVGEMREDFRDQ